MKLAKRKGVCENALKDEQRKYVRSNGFLGKDWGQK